MCLGIPLGVKMGLKGLELVRLEAKASRDNLMVVVENNKCSVDGIQVTTGCTAGSRRLTVYDYGKSAAVFYDGLSAMGFRVTTKPDYLRRAIELAVSDGLMKKGQRLEELSQLEREVMRNAFQKMTGDELFDFQKVRVSDSLLMPSRQQPRTMCSKCGEEIMDGKGLKSGSKVVCSSCFSGPYYTSL